MRTRGRQPLKLAINPRSSISRSRCVRAGIKAAFRKSGRLAYTSSGMQGVEPRNSSFFMDNSSSFPWSFSTETGIKVSVVSTVSERGVSWGM